MSLRVFKFGGSSVESVSRIKNMHRILLKYSEDQLVVVISALGKMTNAFEVLPPLFLSDRDTFNIELKKLIDVHLLIAQELEVVVSDLHDRYQTHVSKCLHDIGNKPDFDFLYDQIVSLGELFSTELIVAYILKSGQNCAWMDIREVIATDDKHQAANVDFEKTKLNTIRKIKGSYSNFDIIVTQGFLGRNQAGFTTTLGREGSDYTASILSSCLDLKRLIIWKDVPGILTGDPSVFEDVIKLDALSYREAIEMTYYGAKVIHPKTIMPLQNKGIILNVRSFLDLSNEGSFVSNIDQERYPPITVIQNDVVLCRISSLDFSFIAENHLSYIFKAVKSAGLKLCLMKNSAVSFTLCFHSCTTAKIEKFRDHILQYFSVKIMKDLDLITIRHYSKEVVQQRIGDREILFEEKNEDTIQFVLKG